ncbi:MAG: DnaB-like helicase C-terminal domain-containing protein, partial [Planctomycetota bacterium]
MAGEGFKDGFKRFDKKERKPSAAEVLQRSPPLDLEAEMGVLGSVMLMPDVLDEVASLKADDFFDDSNRLIYQTLRDMYDTGEKIDITLLVSKLRTANDYDKIGGAAYLAKLSNAVPNAAHAQYYGDIVMEKAVFRRLIESSTDILRDAYDQASTAKELCAQAEQKVFAIMDGRSSQSLHSMSEVLHQSMDRMEARMRDEYVDGGAETGLTDFDQMTGGLHNGELIILAARPSMGKTALAMNIGEHASINQELPVLFVSLEMSGIELADRMLCSLARVNGHRMRNGTLSS